MEQGYEVHGIIRRSSSFNTQRIDHIYRDRHESAVRLKLHYGDLTDSTNLMHIIYEVGPGLPRPSYIYPGAEVLPMNPIRCSGFDGTKRISHAVDR